ncbi:BZ3500_MvSof-1268-A1-R1_Chr6-3g08812 [Microbotryum saponariae]|uniref:BZ3500_MvSof-1268-A1-R1_Chr6-3g08812 protein n=1 Tax=Microbotryum saponariae TaxID=289078 RepID=A0A2X0LCP9_9BASI|nr:BZ3500_MvSof-1268-A1-R1_Chr6-3g08812 [Microbotryum saponariae]SDA07413.1 BZ3501_MvSof-1269-A2-R1_Chr6-2g08515 [Microbotryum saponariae]
MSPKKDSNNKNNNNKGKTLVTRHPALCFNIFFWIATSIYATVYFVLGSERFLKGSMSFFIGFTATARLFYLSPSYQGKIRPGELDALNRKVLARFPCSVVALVFTPAGVLLWLGHQHYVIDLWFFDPER